jgi:hypothetical protein
LLKNQERRSSRSCQPAKHHRRQWRSPSTVCDSSAMMRNRALVVRAISAWRRRGKGPMEECAASLRRRSSTQVSAQSSTARIMLMSSCRVPSSLIRFASRAALGAPCLERVTPVATTAHREVPAGVVSKICGAAGSPTVSRYCGDVSGLSQTVRCLELELQIFSPEG